MSILRSNGRTRALNNQPTTANTLPARVTLKRQRQAENLIADHTQEQEQEEEQGPPPAHNTRHFAQRRQSTSSKSSSSKNTPPPLIRQELVDATTKAITPPPSPPAAAATSRKRKHGDDSDGVDELEASVRLVKIDRDPIISAVCSILASSNTAAAWTARDITAAIIKHKLVDLPHPNPTNVIIQHITSHFRTAREPLLAKEVDERAPRQSKYSLTLAKSELAKLNIDEQPGKRRGSVIKLVVPPSQQMLQLTKELTPATAIDIMEDARSFDDSAIDMLSDAAEEHHHHHHHHHHPPYPRDFITDDLTPLSSALGSPEHDAFLPTPAEEQLPSPNRVTHQSNTQISETPVDGTSNNIDDDEFNTQPQYAMSNTNSLEFDMGGSAVKDKTAPACRVSWESLQDYWDATGIVQSPESVALEDLDSMF